ncbi:MAG TPA: RNA polymerase sigma factor [Pirellulales bacterium]|nr:RNA polymerase sigma factor [Pirellulales bacterium]
MIADIATQVLIGQIQQGDRAALDELCRRYQQRVLAAVRARLGGELRRKIESWDLVQEVMIEAVRRLDGFDFRSEGKFLNYLNRIVEHRIRDEADRQHAQRRDARRELSLDAPRSPDDEKPLDVPGSSSGTPSQLVILGEDLQRLERALDMLAARSADYRELNFWSSPKLRQVSVWYRRAAYDRQNQPCACEVQGGQAPAPHRNFFRQHILQTSRNALTFVYASADRALPRTNQRAEISSRVGFDLPLTASYHPAGLVGFSAAPIAIPAPWPPTSGLWPPSTRLSPQRITQVAWSVFPLRRHQFPRPVLRPPASDPSFRPLPAAYPPSGSSGFSAAPTAFPAPRPPTSGL